MNADTNSNAWTPLFENVQPGVEYRVKIQNAKKNSGSATQFSVVIFDFDNPSGQRAIAENFVSFGSEVATNITCPTNANATHRIGLIIYAGIRGNTTGNNVTFTNINVATNGNIDSLQYTSSSQVTIPRNIQFFARWTSTGGSGTGGSTTCSHVWGSYEKNASTHWQTCVKCGAKKGPTPHSWHALGQLGQHTYQCTGGGAYKYTGT